MRKQNPKIRWHLTPREKRRIRELTLAGVRQSEIARVMRVGRDTVAKWQVKMALPTVPPVPEEDIVRLLRDGIGQNKIHNMLGVSQPKVHEVMVKHGIVHKGGRLSPELREKVIAAIREGENYLNHLADRFGIAPQTIQRIAHQIRRVPRFKGGRVKPPLSSDFPQRYFPQGILTFQHLAQRILDKTFGGEIPEGASAEITVHAAMEAIPALSEALPAAREAFAENLLPALQSQIAMRSLSAGPWVN